MRASTMVWAGWNHVGVRDSPPEVKQLSAAEVTHWFIRVIAENSLAQRMDFVIARTSEEVHERLSSRGKSDSVTTDFGAILNDPEMADWLKGFDELKES